MNLQLFVTQIYCSTADDSILPSLTLFIDRIQFQYLDQVQKKQSISHQVFLQIVHFSKTNETSPFQGYWMGNLTSKLRNDILHLFCLRSDVFIGWFSAIIYEIDVGVHLPVTINGVFFVTHDSISPYFTFIRLQAHKPLSAAEQSVSEPTHSAQ